MWNISSNAQTLYKMFKGCTSFDQSIKKWRVEYDKFIYDNISDVEEYPLIFSEDWKLAFT